MGKTKPIAKRPAKFCVNDKIQPRLNLLPDFGEGEESELTGLAARPSDVIKIEKNLASLGFFTPSHKRISGVRQKVVALSREADGKRIEARATILPSAQYGLPTTADQDTYLAILKLATEMHRKQGKVTNPIGFTSAEILRIQGKSCVSGYHYKELHEQLMRIKTATILSEGAVYFAGRKIWAKDAFNVITRLVLLGTHLDDGTVADRHYVWFSDWQLENINGNYLLPIDYDSYKQLHNHIAKILVPLLQIWLYASRDQGCFEKRYEEVCQFLNVRVYEHLSKIKEKLGPSLDELKSHGYLSDWRLERTRDGDGYKLILYHGEKFQRDLRKPNTPRLKTGITEAPAAETTPVLAKLVDKDLLDAMRERGISEDMARELLIGVGAHQPVLDQLEWGDYLVGKSKKFYNPPGFYVHLVKANVTPPEHFETSRKRKLQERAEKVWSKALEEKARLELDYMEYRRQGIDRHISDKFPGESYKSAIEAKKRELRKTYKDRASWADSAWTELATARFRSEIAKALPLLSFEAFCEQRKAN
jgi:hypothetical protein